MMTSATNNKKEEEEDDIPYLKACSYSASKEDDDEEEDEDDRPLVSDLLAEHASHLDEMRQLLEKDPSYNQAVSLSSSSSSSSSSYTYKYDEIWMLRFWLTHKPSMKKATKAALGTIQFRKEYQLDELGDIRHKLIDHTKSIEENRSRIFDIHHTYMKSYTNTDEQAMIFTVPDKNRGLITYFRPDFIDQQKLLNIMSTPKDELKLLCIYGGEIEYQIIDEITRRTNRLTKCCVIWNITNLSFKRDINRTFQQLHSTVAKELQDYYPQRLGCLLVVNPPRFINLMWNLLTPLFPSRSTEKIKLIQCSSFYNYNNNNDSSSSSSKKKTTTKKKKKNNEMKKKKDHANIQHFTKYISRSNLPERYGGNNTEWPPPSALSNIL